MDAAKKLPVDWNNYQITRNDQYTSSMLNAARSVRSMMRGAFDRRDHLGSDSPQPHALAVDERPTSGDGRIGVPRHRQAIPDAQYLTEMILIGLPSLALGWLCAQGMAQWLGATALHSVNASAAKGAEQHGAGRRRS